jgi:hypothetical protein
MILVVRERVAKGLNLPTKVISLFGAGDPAVADFPANGLSGNGFDIIEPLSGFSSNMFNCSIVCPLSESIGMKAEYFARLATWGKFHFRVSVN